MLFIYKMSCVCYLTVPIFSALCSISCPNGYFLLYNYLCGFVYVSCMNVCVYTMRMKCPRRPEEGIWIPDWKDRWLCIARSTRNLLGILFKRNRGLTTKSLLYPYLRGLLYRSKYLICLGKYQKITLLRVFSPNRVMFTYNFSKAKIYQDYMWLWLKQKKKIKRIVIVCKTIFWSVCTILHSHKQLTVAHLRNSRCYTCFRLWPLQYSGSCWG